MRMNPEAQARRFRAQLVRRAIETDAPLLAAILDRYSRAEGMDWAALAQSLDCTVDSLNRVALCRLPRPDRFVEDVRDIAGDYADPDRLAPLLRRLQVLDAFAAHSAVETATPAADQMLLAARDREEGTAEEEPPVQENPSTEANHA
ncbi:MAG TPA: hypothetical protein VFB38_27000 [Chthonomonadaceae bacterium]|nr:hypothetical protein [Chthonomonadaceae bacterium]